MLRAACLFTFLAIGLTARLVANACDGAVDRLGEA